MFSGTSATQIWLEFGLCLALVGFVGPKLSRGGDIIADKTGLSGNWIGIIPLCCANIAPVAACQPVEASTDPDGGWHTEACYPVQRVASNLCFDLLAGQSPGEESLSNDGFIPIHCGLNKASSVVARTTLPADATMLFDGCNMLIALRRPTRTRNRCRPRWNDDVSLRRAVARGAAA